MNCKLYWIGGFVLAVIGFATPSWAVDFEDLSLPPESYYNGSDGAGGFTSGGTFFPNNYSTQYRSWLGWSYSNTTDRETPGYLNQYSALPGSGAGGSDTYGVAFLGAETLNWYNFAGHAAKVRLPAGQEPVSMQVANTTYAANSMLYGDSFAKSFGGVSGDDPDYFELTIIGLDENDRNVVSIGYLLADYRFSDPAQDFIREGWNTVDLSSFQGVGVVALGFGLESTDIGSFGLNTPAYFAMDNLILEESPSVEEPITTDLNHDGMVSRGDVVSLLSYYGTSSPLADIDLDGKVGLTDLAAIQSELGQLASDGIAAVASPPSAVPEPAGFLTLVIGLTALLGSRRRRRRDLALD